MKGEETAALVTEYESKAIERNGIYLLDPAKGNVLFERMHGIAKELRGTSTGRAQFETLLSSQDESVRLNAATECLAWTAKDAIAVLETLENQVGLNGTAAKYTLLEYRAGTLNLNW